MKLTQTARVLRALRRHSTGVCQVDFLLPNTIDGGTPITRLAARVRDLKDQGHNVRVEGERFGTACYVLAPDVEAPAVAAPDAQPPAAPADDGSPRTVLFDMPPQARNAILDDEAA